MSCIHRQQLGNDVIRKSKLFWYYDASPNKLNVFMSDGIIIDMSRIFYFFFEISERSPIALLSFSQKAYASEGHLHVVCHNDSTL